jgi:transcription initiation factor IIE alpha subunit
MIISDQTIPCPECGTKIPFETRQLLMGVQFPCPKCQSLIGLAQESKPLVEEAMNKLEKVKQGGLHP